MSTTPGATTTNTAGNKDEEMKLINKNKDDDDKKEKKEEVKPAPAPPPPPPPPPPPKPEPPFLIEHDSDLLRYWDRWVLLVANLIIIILPVRIGFFITSVNEWLAFDLVADVTHILDMLIRTRRTFTNHGEVIRDPIQIQDLYVSSSEFILDVISIIPIDLGSIALPQYRPCFLSNRFFRAHRVWDALSQWEMVTSVKPSLISMVKSLLYFYYVTHIDGCVKHLILYLEDNDAEIRWMTATDYLRRGFWDRYWRANYLSLVAASGFNSPTPTTPVECLVSIFDCVFSIAVFGVIIGLFATLISNLDAARVFFFHQLDEANEYMKTQRLSKELVDSVNHYYEYLWSSGQALEKNEVLQKLPNSIRHNIAFHVTSSFIKKVPFFKDITREEFFIEICKNLLPRTALPATYIVKKGEMGTEMFFVLRGELNVVLDNGVVVFTFAPGGFFGEIAIMYQTKRTATIIARTYCDMFVLGKTDFSKVMKKFPLESKTIRNIAKERFESINAGEKEKAEAERKRREEELKLATQRAEMTAALNAAIENETHVESESEGEEGEEYEEENEGEESGNNNNDDDGNPFTKKRGKDGFTNLMNKPSNAAELMVKNAAASMLSQMQNEQDQATKAKYESARVALKDGLKKKMEDTGMHPKDMDREREKEENYGREIEPEEGNDDGDEDGDQEDAQNSFNVATRRDSASKPSDKPTLLPGQADGEDK